MDDEIAGATFDASSKRISFSASSDYHGNSNGIHPILFLSASWHHLTYVLVESLLMQYEPQENCLAEFRFESLLGTPGSWSWEAIPGIIPIHQNKIPRQAYVDFNRRIYRRNFRTPCEGLTPYFIDLDFFCIVIFPKFRIWQGKYHAMILQVAVVILRMYSTRPCVLVLD